MKIVKTEIEAKERRLSTEWTAEQILDVEHEISDELQKAINDEVLNTIVGPVLVDEGFTQVIIGSWQAIPGEWLAENIIGEYKCFGYYWYFEMISDATAFKLRWA